MKGIQEVAMSKYIYPAVFVRENGLYSVDFPDLKGCRTAGDSLADAMIMAEDVLAFALYCRESRSESIPTPSETESIQIPSEGFVNLVACDTLSYQRRNRTRAVKKTLTIPEWLDAIAKEHNANFSHDLQEILIEKYVKT